MSLRAFNFSLANKLQQAADDLAQQGFIALRDGLELITDAPKPKVRVALARNRILFWRQADRCGLSSTRYQF